MTRVLNCKRFVFLVFIANSVFLLLPSHSCHDNERSALLQFKHSFVINCEVASDPETAFPKVRSWGGDESPQGEDCCSWDGVCCDEETSHITELDLQSSCLYGTFPNNSTLFTLIHLQHLNLRDNHFNLSLIPSLVGQLTKLVSLDLSDSVFSGQIPLAISNLSLLSVLDLSKYHFSKADDQLTLEDPGLEKLVQNLTLLSQLCLQEVSISSSVPRILANCTHLERLVLSFCNLMGRFPTDVFHLSHLQRLDLCGNEDIEGFLPKFDRNNAMRVLILSNTAFFGRIPLSIGRLGSLQCLDLSNSHFSGTIPSSLGNLTKLKKLALGYNDFSGDIPSSITNLMHLQWLTLSNINIRPRKLTRWISNQSKLTYLSLHDSDLPGELPSLLRNLTQLEVLSLTENQLKGPIFHGLSQLAHLDTLVLSGNANLSDSFDQFLNLKHITYLDLSGVQLSFSSNAANESPNKLEFLYLDSCKLTQFPQFLNSQNELQELGLSNNHIHGLIPQWLVNVTKHSLHTLDLSHNFLTGFEQPVVDLPWRNLEILYFQHNQIQGSLPIPPTSMVIYQISNNLLAGGIPHQLCYAQELAYLDVSNNKLRGPIPKCITDLGSSLLVLNLQNNEFLGTIPESFSKSCNLRMINLAQNQLEGQMPRSLANCMKLEVLDIARNHVNDSFPSWLGTLPKLQILVLGHNNFHGTIGWPAASHDFRSLHIIDLSHNFHTGDLPVKYLQIWSAMKVSNEEHSLVSRMIFQRFVPVTAGVHVLEEEYNYSITITNKGNEMLYSRILTVFRAIDFSSNNFTANIPNAIANLRGLQAVNLSNNNLVGKIPSSLANMTDLESLDLSNNMISGEIPQELTQMTFLEVFNVSNNRLMGRIPQEQQFGTFDYSCFVGNPGLCGSPLSKKCDDAFVRPPHNVAMESNNDNEEDSVLIDWVIRCLGCISGFGIGCAFGKYFTDRNHEWFAKTFGKTKEKRRTRSRRVARG